MPGAPALVFESRRDPWVVLLLGGAALVDLVAAAYVLRVDLPLAPKAVALFVLLVSAVLVVWILRGTRYLVDGNNLTAWCGPFRWQIPLSGITAVEPTRTPVSSPALSLDRLRIRHGNGKSLVVSPADRERFCQALGQPPG